MMCAGCGVEICTDDLAIDGDGCLCSMCEEQLASPDTSWKPMKTASDALKRVEDNDAPVDICRIG